MTINRTRATALAMMFSFAGPAHALEPNKWFVEVGPANVDPNLSASVSAAGNEIPNSEVKASDETTLGIGIGYYLRDSLSLHLLLGKPLSTELTGAGSLTGITAGDVDYAPITMTANYHFDGAGPISGFVGAGIVFLKVLDEDDGQILNLSVDDTSGFALRVGVSYQITDKGSGFLSLTKMRLSTDVTGTAAADLPAIGGAPLSSDFDLDPTVIQIGYRHQF